MRSFLIILLAASLSSCATLQPKEVAININLFTVDKDMNPIDAYCNLYSASSKLDVLAPKKFTFLTQCSSINILCKSGNLTGQHGIVETEETTTGQDFIINSGIGYLFDRAVDTVTPMGSLINFFGDDEECLTEREITVVLQ